MKTRPKHSEIFLEEHTVYSEEEIRKLIDSYLFGKVLQKQFLYFYRDNYKEMVDEIKSVEGLKIHMSPRIKDAERLAKRAFLLSDLIIFSPPSSYRRCDPTFHVLPVEENVIGIQPIFVSSFVLEWAKFLLRAKPVIEAGYIAYMPRWGDPYRWLKADFFPKYFPEDDILYNIPDDYQQIFYDHLTCLLAGSIVFDSIELQLYQLKDNQFLMPNVSCFSTDLQNKIVPRLQNAILKFDLPFLDNIDFETLLKIRQDYPQAFNEMKKTLNAAIYELKNISLELLDLDKEIRRIQRDIIDDGLDRVQRRIQRLKRLSLFRTGKLLLGVTVTCICPFIGPPLAKVIGSLVGSSTLLDAFSAYADYLSSVADLREDSMWVLWKLREVSKK